MISFLIGQLHVGYDGRALRAGSFGGLGGI